MYLSFGGGAGELREDFPAIKAPEKTCAGSFRNEERQMSVESAKGQKDNIGKDSVVSCCRAALQDGIMV